MSNRFDEITKILEFIEESDYQFLNLDIDGMKLTVNKNGENGSLMINNQENNIEKTSNQDHYEKPSEELFAGDTIEKTKERETAKPSTDYENDDTHHVVRAPMLGTFYRSSDPNSPPYVEVNDTVASNDTICLIEVMKLFNSLSASVSGRVIDFLVEDGQMVEYDQPIAVIELSNN